MKQHFLSYLQKIVRASAVVIFLLAATLFTPFGLVTHAATAPQLVSLSSYVNNKGIGSAPGQGNFDGSQYAYPASQVPTGQVTYNSVPYQMPVVSATGNDNVVALGQRITLTQGSYQAISFLISSSFGPATGTATVTYTDGTTTATSLIASDWYSGGVGVVNTTSRYTPTGTENHAVALFAVQMAINGSKVVSSLTLPTTAQPSAAQPSMHIFAISVLPTAPQVPAANVLSARSTTRVLTGTTSTQVVEAIIQNTTTTWITPTKPITVTVQATNVQNAVPAVITELGPGEETVVEVGIQHSASVAAGTQEPATVVAHVAGSTDGTFKFTLTVGIAAYSATNASLNQHESPDWFNNAKFGIFIHWGIYSVPAWAPTKNGASTEYAEWYWKQMNNSSDPTYQHHLQTYGKNFNYDDFIPQFTAAKYDPKAWVQLFQQAGAKYFVDVTKHHDGFALFNTKYSNRNAVAMGPHKDLVKALFDAAATYAPDLKRGVYYSMPEWYNPSYPGDSADGSFPGGGPHNPYTGAAIPYTGYIPVASYVNNFQEPQMEELINNYKPDILWCDIGGPNASNTVFADYFNHGQASGQQVTVNNRCGNSAHDFTTPEYKTLSTTTIPKWESNRGIDPFSFGYNSATATAAYATSDQLISDLVDITSKNGNLLLDIGPKADGTIPTVMQQRLQDIGAWLKTNGEAIYNTTYWWRTPQDGNVRFTVSPNKAFYMTSLVNPGNQLVVNQPVPIQAGDQITMLGYNGGALAWTQQGSKLTVTVPAAAQQAGQHAWVFKITWK